MAISLLGATKTGLLAYAPLVSMVGTKVWTAQAPEGTGLPVVIINHGRSSIDWSFDRSQIERSSVGLDIYAETAQACEDIRNAATDALDDYTAEYNINNHILAYVRNSMDLSVEQDRSPNGKPVFKSAINYTVLVQVDASRSVFLANSSEPLLWSSGENYLLWE